METLEKSPSGASEVQPEPPKVEPEPPYPSSGYAWYVVLVLTIAYTLSFIDRQVLNLMVGPIKRDLGINDFQMSLLMGMSFAVFYTFFGIPLGRLADSQSRRGMIAAGLGAWSLMTSACGLARRYYQLFFARIGVGVGEAALSPPAYSLITDYFPPHKLATAISVYSAGIYLGSGLATFIPGLYGEFIGSAELHSVPLLGQLHGWQVFLIGVGLPGILITPLFLTIREPFRRGLKRRGGASGAAVRVTTRDALAYMNRNSLTLACHTIGFGFLSFSSYGSTAWIPEFLIRTYGFSRKAAGIDYGIIVGTAGAAGVIFGGRLADWLAARGYRDSKMRSGLIAAIVWAPFGMVYPLLGDSRLALLLIIPAVFTSSMPFGAAPAAIQEMMPNSMRAQASAVYLFVINLIGLGCGPSAVAAVTDYYFKDPAALRYSLLYVTTTAHVVSTILLFIGLKQFLKSMDRLKQWTAANG